MGGAQWVLDVEEIVARGNVDWTEVLSYARTRAFVLTLAGALARVRGVPTEVLSELNEMDASYLEALELRNETNKFDRHGAEARHLLEKLRSRSDVVELAKYEGQKPFPWDNRWVREWR